METLHAGAETIAGRAGQLAITPLSKVQCQSETHLKSCFKAALAMNVSEFRYWMNSGDFGLTSCLRKESSTC
jgi:hypothetical protein